MHEEILKQIQMTYEEQCNYLQQKYGLPPRDYFSNETCRSKVKKNSRTGEGLFLHHNAEAYGNGGNLGEPHMARICPFEYQKRENLSYCNYLEHLILHLKINARGCSTFEWPDDFKWFFRSLGFFFICGEMNTLYKNAGSEIPWRNNCYLAIQDLFEDYVSILKGTLCFLEDHYVGPRTILIEKGAELGGMIPRLRVESEKGNAQSEIEYKKLHILVQDINFTDNIAVLKFGDGSQGKYDITKLKNTFSLEYQKKKYIRQMCSLDSAPVWDTLEQLLNEEYTADDKLVAQILSNSLASR